MIGRKAAWHAYSVRVIYEQTVESIAKLTSITLANVSVVGFGLAIFDQRVWCSLFAILSFSLACFIEWRAEHE